MLTWKQIIENSAGWSPEALSEILLQTQDQKAVERYFLVTCGANSKRWSLPEQSRLISFGKGFHLDEYTAKQRLNLQAPRIWKAVTSKQKAEDWVEWMMELGIPAFFVLEDRFKNARFADTEIIQLNPSGMEFRVGKNELKIKWDQVGLAVTGKLKFQISKEKAQESLGESARTTLSHSELFFIDFHLVGKKEILRMIDPFRRDFEVVENYKLTKKPKNPMDLMEQIQKFHPAISIYDHFEHAQAAYGDSIQIVSRQQTASRAKGIARMIQPVSNQTEKILETNPLPLFDLYSVLCRYEFRKMPRG